MTAHHRHLSLEDRIEIQRLAAAGVLRAEIASRIDVHCSTITREFKRGSWQPEHDHANLRPYLRNKLNTRDRHECLYLGGQAQLAADTRKARSHAPHRMGYDRLIDGVIAHLRQGWTPEEIAGRIRIEFPDDPQMRVSMETLYAWVHDPAQRHRQFWQYYLSRGHRKRRPKPGRSRHSYSP